MTTDALLALLQLGDGLFPAGGFAHSFGLETYAQEGRVRDRAGLEAFVTAHLEGAAGPGDAVAVAIATRLATAGDLAAWCELDARVDAMKAVPEFRAASRQMGRQTARVAAALGDDAFLTGVARAIDERLAPGHQAAARRRPLPISTRRRRCSSAPGCDCSRSASSTASACSRARARASRGSPRRPRARRPRTCGRSLPRSSSPACATRGST